jgi:hypothetical protein
MTVRLIRTSATRPLATLGVEVVDGHARAWQTSGNRVGRFARALSPAELSDLQRHVEAARSAGDSGPSAAAQPAPHRVVDQLTGDGLADLVLPGAAAPPAASADLVRLLRALRDDLAASPVSAVALEVSGSPLGALLTHVGSEPIAVRAATVEVRAATFDEDSAVVDIRTRSVDLAVDGAVGPGWQAPLVGDLGFGDLPEGGFRTVGVRTIDVDSLGDGVLRPAELSWSSE